MQNNHPSSKNLEFGPLDLSETVWKAYFQLMARKALIEGRNILMFQDVGPSFARSLSFLKASFWDSTRFPIILPGGISFELFLSGTETGNGKN